MNSERLDEWDKILEGIKVQTEKTSDAIDDLVKVLHELAHTAGSLAGRWILKEDFTNWICAECGFQPLPAPSFLHISIINAFSNLGYSATKAENEALRGVGPFVALTQA